MLRIGSSFEARDSQRPGEPRLTYDCAASLPILGLPVRFEAADPALLDAALAGYVMWRDVALSPPDAAGVSVRLTRLDADSSALEMVVEPTVLVSGSRIRVCAPGLEGVADWVTGEASCQVADWLVADPQRLAGDLLDTLLLFMLTRRNRVPLHAAGIVRNGVAALLCAPSGVGKSSLALAAVQHGFKLLSDDAVYLESLNGSGVRVWGWPRAVHVAPVPVSAAPDAGGAAGALPLRLRNGRWKHAHALGDAWASPPVAERGVLFLLERADRRPCARRVEPDEAVSTLLAGLDPGFDVFRGSLPAPFGRLAAAGAWRLSLSPGSEETLAGVAGIIGA